MGSKVIDFGLNAAGIRETVVVSDDRVEFRQTQSDASEAAAMKLVHEVGRDGYNKKSGFKPLANVPMILRYKWQKEFQGKLPSQRLGSAPCKHMTWAQFYMLKLSQYEYSRLRF